MQKVLFRSDSSGFTVLRVAHPGGVSTAVGEGLALSEGEEVVLSGGFIDHPKYGPQFRVEGFRPITPDTAEGIRRFLTSGLIKGIGPSTAERLIGAFGDGVLEALEDGPDRIAPVKGVGRKRAQRIHESYREHRRHRDLLVFLQSHGIGTALALRIHKRYGVFALDRIRENPYRLALEVRGVGFLTADRLALSLGLDPLSVERAEAGILHKLEEAHGEGHLYLPFEELVTRTERDLKTRPDVVARAMLSLDGKGLIVRDGDAIYLAAAHELEVAVAQGVAELSQRTDPERGAGLAGHLAAARQRLGFDLSDDQVAAVRAALCQRITAITGGPGTGKTTLVRAVCAVAQRLRLRVELASPTGRAAKRLAEATGERARTIHRMLEFDPESGLFQRNAGQPLRCDLLLIDESSMIDMMLMASILDALPGNASLVLVGDADQLPSVGAGTVFRDVVECRSVPVARLSHIYRQARGSLIVENAHRILHGEQPEAPAEAEPGQDFFLAFEEDPERIVAMVKMLVRERIPKRFGFDPVADVQVLAPMHRGTAGVGNLNRQLQELLNPGRTGLRVGDQTFRVGDKVMQIRNDYDKEVWNGDVGRIASVDTTDKSIEVSFDDRLLCYLPEELTDLVLAYASSIHKAQGSEYPAVVVVLAREHYIMCQRNLLYTAVTRGKALTVVVGSRSAVRRAVENDQVKRRYSRLRERIVAASSELRG